MKTNYYIITYSAEEVATKVVQLTEDEARGIQKMCDAPILIGGGYCGNVGISEPYASEEMAKLAAYEEIC